MCTYGEQFSYFCKSLVSSPHRGSFALLVSLPAKEEVLRLSPPQRGSLAPPLKQGILCLSPKEGVFSSECVLSSKGSSFRIKSLLKLNKRLPYLHTTTLLFEFHTKLGALQVIVKFVFKSIACYKLINYMKKSATDGLFTCPLLIQITAGVATITIIIIVVIACNGNSFKKLPRFKL